MVRNIDTKRTVRTTNSPRTLIEMFLDGTTREVYNDGRLLTRQNGDVVELVAYGNEVLASIDEGANEVALYTGHFGQVSETVTGYIRELGRALNETEEREVNVFHEAAPTLGYGARVTDSAQYISSYVRYVTQAERSPVERKAVEEVNRALRERVAQIFG